LVTAGFWLSIQSPFTSSAVDLIAIVPVSIAQPEGQGFAIGAVFIGRRQSIRMVLDRFEVFSSATIRWA
jgi:hypothetical protein